MSLTVDQAARAGVLAAAIKARQDKIAEITNAIAFGNRQVSRFAVVGPNEEEVNLLLDRLDAQTSAQALQFALGIYQAQLSDLQTELAAIA